MKKGVEVVRAFLRSKRKLLLGAIVACVVLASGLIVWWQAQPVVEAAILDPHPGLVGWWRFDEGDGSLAEDGSGNGNDGIITGATWTIGKFGNALRFDGTNYVRVPSSSSLNQTNIVPRTICMWLQFDNVNDNMDPFTYFDSGLGTTSNTFKFQTNAKRIRFYAGTGNVYSDTISITQAGVWYFVVFVFDGISGQWYINGVANGSPSAITMFSGAEIGVVVGANRRDDTGALSNPFKGTADEVRIYNRTLSVAEIQQIFQENPCLPSKLLVKVPRGTSQIISTISWQGTGSVNITVESPSEIYTEDAASVYQKTTYSTTSGVISMLNIKRVSISVTVLPSDENWYIMLEYEGVDDYSISVEVQK